MEIYRRYTREEDNSESKAEPNPNKHGSYGTLLFDVRWKQKRGNILLLDNNKCVICGLNEDLQVHHRQYQYINALKKFKAPWEYPDRMLITLCSSCHQRGHAKYKVPIIYI
ncbi:hypothetical protein SAMN05443550_11719 [Pedobacter hartonius]|uniref:HNH endonuclease n=1 Tax=Pedobacter hartonius TaxID=425514 RepID=A0A1H4HG89_9SPHI|nr:hypothetical protein SAMN05443550_11719 [Pedobacter hartonius]